MSILLNSRFTNSARLDSIENNVVVAFSTVELQSLAKLLNEIEYRRLKDSLTSVEIEFYNDAINRFSDKQIEWERLRLSLIQQLNETLPKWYERPLVVSGFTSLMLFTLYYLLK
ncbi:MAG: hypothetical protein KF721_04805 [Ignavibacteriaceae bacterium]|nr:hypothetical protein [Ignavibacteriaceae bacterium]